MANRLKDEQSPYLLQHAHNPVDWYPWGDEAFKRAENENKPVLVSIGYAACHWCHVMERESFENEETAAYMNEHFVCVKVDREEHPDVDHMYMDAVQAIVGSGGWPLNVFVTPERIPFYGGTYFPPKPLYGRQSWLQILEKIQELWNVQRDEITAQGEQMYKYLNSLSDISKAKGEYWTKDICDTVAKGLLQNADKELGGFGTAPKFPGTMCISYLLEHYYYTGDEESLRHALKSLDAMLDGGIYDQVGGGLCRYSTDAKWLAPHFEKMLYDNALLAITLTDAYSITKYEHYKDAIHEIITFVNRELRHESGGLYCALDADSEGVEGKYYTWTWEEWKALVGDDEIATQYFGIEEGGNWDHTNILHVAKSIADIAVEHDMSEGAVKAHIAAVKEQISAARQGRIRLGTDDKCLLSWNALMNLALSKAGMVLDNEHYLQQATTHMQWMMDNYAKEKEWQHTWKNGVARITAKLDDLAYLSAAMLQLAQATGDNQYILHAKEVMKIVVNDFSHKEGNFFYYSSAKQQDIPVRKTDLYDGAQPSANAIAAMNLVTLGLLTEDNNMLEAGQYMLHQMAQAAMRYPSSFAQWAIYGQRYAQGLQMVVYNGGAEMSKIITRGQFVPQAYFADAGSKTAEIPLLDGKNNPGKQDIYLCDMEACRKVSDDITEVLQLLRK